MNRPIVKDAFMDVNKVIEASDKFCLLNRYTQTEYIALINKTLLSSILSSRLL